MTSSPFLTVIAARLPLSMHLARADRRRPCRSAVFPWPYRAGTMPPAVLLLGFRRLDHHSVIQRSKLHIPSLLFQPSSISRLILSLSYRQSIRLTCAAERRLHVHVAHATHAHATHAAHPAFHAGMAVAAGFLLLGLLGDEAVGGQQQTGDADGVLQGDARDLGRVDDAGFDQVLILVRVGVVAEAALALARPC